MQNVEIYFRFNYMQNVENLLPSHDGICRTWKISFKFKYPVCGKTTFDSSIICRMWQIYFRFMYMQNVKTLLSIQLCRMWKIYFHFKCMQNVENLLSFQVQNVHIYRKSTFDSHIRFKYIQYVPNLLPIHVHSKKKSSKKEPFFVLYNRTLKGSQTNL